jgi:hypothetical protein
VLQFHLVPVKTEICPSNLKYPSLPPEEEVKKKNYLYYPCPMDIEDPFLNNQFIHELCTPGAHLDRYWIDSFPKKLNGKLAYVSGQRPFGWGIHIVEGPNWYAFAFLAYVIILSSGILSVIYAILRRDISSGFGMGSYAISVLTLFVTLGYLKWQQG